MQSFCLRRKQRILRMSEVDTENSERGLQPKNVLARTQLIPLHMNVLNIIGDANETMKIEKQTFNKIMLLEVQTALYILIEG